MAREDFVTPAHLRVPDADAAILGSTGQVAALWVSEQKEDKMYSHSARISSTRSPASAPEVNKRQVSLLG